MCARDPRGPYRIMHKMLPPPEKFGRREHRVGADGNYGAMRVAFAVPFNSIVVPSVAGGTG
jgi:hypothetical protein